MRKETNKERIKALNLLKDMGVLVHFNESLKLYHGRAKEKTENCQWKVVGGFENSGNATGHNNINKVNALSTSDFNTAKEFADARSRFGDKVAEVHRIVSYDPEAVIFNSAFDYSKLSEEEKGKMIGAFKRLTNSFSVSELAPVKFEDREKFLPVLIYLREKIKETENGLFTLENIRPFYDNWPEKDKVDYQLFFDVAGAVNAKKICMYSPKYIIRHYIYDRENVECIINFEYVASWLYHNHIVGMKDLLISATLNKKISNYMLFDTEKINTERVVGDKYVNMLNMFQEFYGLIEDFSDNKEMLEFLTNSSPVSTLKAFKKQVSSTQELFDLDSGVWENYTVGQHTEAVLRVFEDSFSDNVPNNLIPFIKIALVSHDLGKGFANGKAKQKDLNIKFANYFYDRLKLKPEAKEILSFIIGESQEYTTAYYVNKDENANLKLIKACYEKIKDVFKIEAPTKGMVQGLSLICTLLQNCDSGSYTRYAKIRDEKTNVHFYGGSDKFTESFNVKQETGRYNLRLKKPSQPVAPSQDKSK